MSSLSLLRQVDRFLQGKSDLTKAELMYKIMLSYRKGRISLLWYKFFCDRLTKN